MPETPQPTFVNVAGLARALFMDHRTLRNRLRVSGIQPDALFLEGAGVTDLFSVDRIPQIRDRVSDFVELRGVECGIVTQLLKK